LTAQKAPLLSKYSITAWFVSLEDNKADLLWFTVLVALGGIERGRSCVAISVHVLSEIETELLELEQWILETLVLRLVLEILAFVLVLVPVLFIAK